MELSPKMNWIVWLLWIVFFSLGIYASLFFPNFITSENWATLASLLLLTIIIALQPITMNGSPVFFIIGVSLLAFLLFGLFTEIIITQLGLVLMSIRSKFSKEELYKIGINSLMFLIISFLSASSYYLSGGNHEPINFTNLMTYLPLVAYFFVSVTTNQIIVVFLYRIFSKSKKWVLTLKDFILELGTESYVFIAAVLIYVLYEQFNINFLLQAIILYAGAIFIFRLLYSSNTLNSFLEKAYAIGHELSKKHSEKEIFKTFINNIPSIIKGDWIYVYLIEKDQLVLQYSNEIDVEQVIHSVDNYQDDPAFIQLKNIKKSFHLRNQKYILSLSSKLFHNKLKSSLVVPILLNGNINGVIIIGSKNKDSYEKKDNRILDILVTTLDISLQNAKNYKSLKKQSETCSLTNLNNHRALETKLEKAFQKLQTELTSITVIIADLDKFKIINDLYGHEAGDDILRSFGNLLHTTFEKEGFVARQGGEEFAIVLFNTTLKNSILKAEKFRELVEHFPIETKNYLLTDEVKISVNITCSFGIASSENNDFDSRSIIQAADRAMYIGSKNKGRNRVSTYSEVNKLSIS